MKKAVIYARVSSKIQVEEGLSIDAQISQLRDYAVENGYEVVAEYVDKGESAKTADRPQFQQMIKDIKNDKGNYDAVLIHKTDRFARNREDSIVYKSLLRRDCEVDVIAIKEDFGEGPIGKMIEGILEVIAEFYSENLAREVEKGQREKAKAGQAVGKPPIGYIIGEDGKYQIQEQEAEIVKYIFQEYIDGKGTQKIALALQENEHDFSLEKSTGEIMKWNNLTILRILQNNAYIGTFEWQDIKIENNHSPIISKSDFKLVQDLTQKRKTRRNYDKYDPYLLQGVLKCYECHGTMHRQFSRQTLASGKVKTYVYARCTNHGKYNNCYGNSNNMDKIEKYFIQALESVSRGEVDINKLNILVSQTDSLEKKYESIKDKLNNFDKQFERQMKAYEAGVINLKQLQSYKDRLKEEKEELLTEFKTLENKIKEKTIDEESFMTTLRDVIETLKSHSPIQRKKNAVSRIIKEVRVSSKKNLIEVVYKW
ncbi:DNA invertase Pin-like site-specific DNA recombinase [Orenia metallireducens]|uniref:Site-specific DNA recombinase n=1 Tax=Orenia metallireducens TaxID=1413210 RepID=A0A285I8X3_9FIRM|nr:recombinase family protein [Orenia metallireducens]PRX21691.1 DNA invertase Pin-like site-specific DNA recombinase [Orenia metallireducens]SNY44430.1 Site-specific DNA recombinase [Orenia metallireducens]